MGISLFLPARHSRVSTWHPFRKAQSYCCFPDWYGIIISRQSAFFTVSFRLSLYKKQTFPLFQGAPAQHNNGSALGIHSTPAQPETSGHSLQVYRYQIQSIRLNRAWQIIPVRAAENMDCPSYLKRIKYRILHLYLLVVLLRRQMPSITARGCCLCPAAERRYYIIIWTKTQVLF